MHIAEKGFLPHPNTIIAHEVSFRSFGTLSEELLWFKTKLMCIVNNRTWDPLHKTPTGYYNKCLLTDEAMGLWLLHFKDKYTIIKKETSTSDVQNNKERTRLRGDSKASIEKFMEYKRQLESI